MAIGIVVSWYGGPDAGGLLPFPTVRRILGGVVPGWPWGRTGGPAEVYTYPGGGQEDQLRSTRTPSPAVVVVAGELLVLRVVACIYLGGGKVAHGTIGHTDKLRGIPEGQRYLWGGDIPRAPGCSLRVTICWLWADTLQSRLTCSRKPVATDRIGTPAKSGGTDAAPSAGPCGCSRCADEAPPLGPPEALCV